MKFISYSQNSEDVLLWRALGHVANGFYIDVGANDPEEHSVTKAFYDAGWRGVSIEPLPAFHQAFLEQRPRDINLALAAGSDNGELTLYDTPQVRGWASPERSVAELHRSEGHEVVEMTVPVRTLASVCEEHVQGEIHFLKIDVEGFEGEVLKGMDFARWRPWVLVIEATLPNSRETRHASWEHLVTSQRYRFAWFDGLNRYYVAEEHAELLPHFGIQPNVFDDYIPHHLDKAWKNNASLEAQLRQRQEDAERQAQWQRELETQLRQHRAELDEFSELLQQGEVRNRKLEQELEAAQQQAMLESEQAADALAQLREELGAAHEANREMADWARSLDERLVATLASTSWKITAPVRRLGALQQALRRPRLLRRVVNRLTANERLRRLLIPVLRSHPAIGERVTATIAAVKLDPPQQAPAGIEVPEELKGLPVSVRRVLADLKRAQANQQAGQ